MGKPGPLFGMNIYKKFRNNYYFFSSRGAADKEGLSHLTSMLDPRNNSLLVADLPQNLFVLQWSQNHTVILSLSGKGKSQYFRKKKKALCNPEEQQISRRAPVLWHQSIPEWTQHSDTAGEFCCVRHPHFRLSFSLILRTFTLIEFRKTTMLKRGVCRFIFITQWGTKEEQ